MQKNTSTDKHNFTFQRNIALVSILLFLAKLLAWNLTGSDAVFTDAMESIVNIIAAFMGLYSLYLAAKPKDYDHPYGHGKAEFVTSGVEGAMIIFAGIIIIIESVQSLINGNVLQKLDYGIVILFITGLINYFLGYLSIRKGKRENSAVLISSGKHLQSDTVTSVGLTIGLLLVFITKQYWLDAVLALAFSLYIIVVGYKIIRESLRGIMDEADPELLENLAKFLNGIRKPQWIDVHNMRIQQHGSKLHIDAHLTLPWYFQLREAHAEMEELIVSIAKNNDRPIEFNFHMDDCREFCCPICTIENCPVRQHNFVKKIEWDAENISQTQKHSLKDSRSSATVCGNRTSE